MVPVPIETREELTARINRIDSEIGLAQQRIIAYLDQHPEMRIAVVNGHGESRSYTRVGAMHLVSPEFRTLEANFLDLQRQWSEALRAMAHLKEQKHV